MHSTLLVTYLLSECRDWHYVTGQNFLVILTLISHGCSVVFFSERMSLLPHKFISYHHQGHWLIVDLLSGRWWGFPSPRLKDGLSWLIREILCGTVASINCPVPNMVLKPLISGKIHRPFKKCFHHTTSLINRTTASYTPRLKDVSGVIVLALCVCVCVCLSVRLSVRLTLTAERIDIQPWILAWTSSGRISRSSS